jgi:Bacterial type II and III secretion system protein/Polysaccharide biosynthesis/export protein
MVSDAIWLAALAVGQFWMAGNLGSLGVPNYTEKGLLRQSNLKPVTTAEQFVDPPAGTYESTGLPKQAFNKPASADSKLDVHFPIPQTLPPQESRILIGPALKPGELRMCEQPPDIQAVLRAMPKVTRGIPYIYEEFRDDIEITTEKILDRVDAPRFYPLIGPAQLHHCHWKCTVYFTETIESSYPYPFKTKKRKSEVVYIDNDRLYLCALEPQQRPQYNVDATFQTKVCYADDILHPNRQIPGLMGRVWVFSQTFEAVKADGTIIVEMYDQNPEAKGKPQCLSVWKFDAAVLAQLESKDNIGLGYSLFLPCDPGAARVDRVKLSVKYEPRTGAAAATESAVLKLRYTDGLSPAEQTEESNEPPLNAPPKKSVSDCVEEFLIKMGVIKCEPSDPMVRMEQFLIDSENLRKMHEEWRKFWMQDQPKVLTPCPAPAGVCRTPLYRVAAPDILVLEAHKLVPRKPGDVDGPIQQIRGDYLIRPDGTIALGMFGNVCVDGMTLRQVKSVVEHHLAAYVVEPQVTVDVKAYNSRKIYVVVDANGRGQEVIALPWTGNDTVLDAVEKLPNLPKTPLKMWVSRPTKCEPQTLAVDWKGITQSGKTETNFLLNAGDRLYVTSESATQLPHPVAPKAMNSTSAAQIQVEVLIASVDSESLKKLPLSGNGNEQTRFEVICNSSEIVAMLQRMRRDGKAKLISEPRVTTLGGRRAYICSGGEVPILVTSGQEKPTVHYKQFGTLVDILPTMQSDGRVRMEIKAELSEPNPALDVKLPEGRVIPGFDSKCAQVTAIVASGQTIAITGQSLRKGVEHHIILVTGRVVEPICAEPKARMEKMLIDVNGMTVADIVQLSKRGISDDIIIRQMEQTQSTFTLSVADILNLNENGVSDNVIRAMQNRRPTNVAAPMQTPNEIFQFWSGTFSK